MASDTCTSSMVNTVSVMLKMLRCLERDFTGFGQVTIYACSPRSTLSRQNIACSTDLCFSDACTPDKGAEASPQLMLSSCHDE